MREVVPALSLLCGGVGNQILQGKLRVGTCYPLCRQAITVLPACLHDAAQQIDYADCTFDKEYSRRDDAKIDAAAKAEGKDAGAAPPPPQAPKA